MDNTQAINLEDVQADNGEKKKDPIVKTLMRVFWILLVVTIVEISLALLHFEAGFLNRGVLNAIFILLTIVKAFYIVAEFMHLKHEVKTLVWIILIPLLFLIWGIGALLWEGGATKKMREEHRSVIESTTPWENVRHETH